MSRKNEGKNARQAKSSKEKMYMIFVAVVAVLVVGLLLFMLLRQAGVIPSGNAGGSFRADSAIRLSVNNANHAFVLEKKDGTWQLDADATFPVDAEKTGTILQALAGISSHRTLPKSTDPASCGLESPAASVSVSLQNGKEKSFLIGSYDEAAGESFYRTEPDGRIRAFSGNLAYLTTLSEYDLITVPQLPAISSQNVTGIRIENHALSAVTDLRYYPDLRPDIDYSGTCTWFSAFPDGLERPANEDNLPYLMAAIESLRYEYCIGWNVADDVLSAYGFDEPEMEVTLQWNEGGTRRLELIISGSSQGSAYYFVREKDSRNICLLPGSVGMFLESATPDSLTSKNPGYVGLDRIRAFEAVLEGKKITGEILRENGQTLYRINGTEISQYDFTMLYVNFFNLYGKTILPEAPAEIGKTVFSLTMDLVGGDGPQQLVYTISEYDADTLLFAAGGRAWMTMERSQLETLQRTLAEHLTDS